MHLGKSRHGGTKGGRTNAKIVDDLEIVCEPSHKTQEIREKGRNSSLTRNWTEGREARIPRLTPNLGQFLLEREYWPELSEQDHQADYPEPAAAVMEKLEAEREPTKCNMNAEDTIEDRGTGHTSRNEGERSTTKATTFGMAAFLKSNPDLREMELAVVMAIDDMRKQKMLSNEDQARLMYQLPNLCTYQTPVSEGSFFYPGIPLYSLLAEILEEWMYSGASFAKDLFTYEHLDEGNGIERRKMTMDNVTCHMMGIRGSWEGLEDDEKKHKIRQMFKDIGKRGLLDLLGVRRTVGTQDVFPPTRDILETSFRELNKASSLLTVGARALEKHCHRDQSNNWWGRPKGGETSKNDNAERVLNKILNEVGWLNIHQLPHALPILEVRNTDGYGARWSPDGKEFRGFLEPPMIAGWETGYKH